MKTVSHKTSLLGIWQLETVAYDMLIQLDPAQIESPTRGFLNCSQHSFSINSIVSPLSLNVKSLKVISRGR